MYIFFLSSEIGNRLVQSNCERNWNFMAQHVQSVCDSLSNCLLSRQLFGVYLQRQQQQTTDVLFLRKRVISMVFSLETHFTKKQPNDSRNQKYFLYSQQKYLSFQVDTLLRYSCAPKSPILRLIFHCRKTATRK